MEIALITTDALLVELATRFDHYIFAGLKSLDGESEQEIRRHAGGWRTCQGLAQGMIFALEKARDEDIEPMDPEDI